MGMLVRDALALGAQRLAEAGIEASKYDSEELFCFVNGLERSRLFMEWSKEMDEKTFDEYFKLLDIRGSGKPLQYITGHQEFMGFDFKVDESVLIPRQDTEVLVSEALKVISGDVEYGETDMNAAETKKNGKSWKLLDLCTGSGAIGISIAKLAPGATVTATDISSDALKIAEENAQRLGAKVNFAQGDLFGAVKKKIGTAKFDMIISNPPYIRSEVIGTLMQEVKDYEPHLALDGGTDGLDFYRRIIEEAHIHLNNGGYLMLEIGHDQADDVVAISETVRRTCKKKKRANECDEAVYSHVHIIKDLAGLDRVAVLQKIL